MSQALRELRELLGPEGWVEPADQEPYLKEWRGRYRGRAAAVVRPVDTAMTAAVVRHCRASDLAIVPQSGNTGLCGGAAPDGSGSQVLLSLDRLNKIREIDPDNQTITAEAGCTLAAVQRAAAAVGRYFPLDLAAADRTMIGGALATNAGGVNVLHYGNARALALGIEVVLADGRIWNGLRGLRKDNSGYDLRNLFIGSEGTLGIITAGVLRLFTQPAQTVSAVCGLPRLERAPSLLAALQEGVGERLVGCELMSRFSVETALSLPGCEEPLAHSHPWYLLIRVTDVADATPLGERLARVLQRLDMIAEARVASHTQAAALWRLRKAIPAGQASAGASIKHDISVPISRIPAFVTAVHDAVERAVPGTRPCIFGHLGDGNLHVNLSQPPAMAAEAFTAETTRLNRIVHDLTAACAGSIAAEHGIGQLKRAALREYGDPVGLDLMRRIKTALDPDGLLNPGKVL
jgi:FAD/FMN-containing dehydrogenase